MGPARALGSPGPGSLGTLVRPLLAASGPAGLQGSSSFLSTCVCMSVSVTLAESPESGTGDSAWSCQTSGLCPSGACPVALARPWCSCTPASYHQHALACPPALLLAGCAGERSHAGLTADGVALGWSGNSDFGGRVPAFPGLIRAAHCTCTVCAARLVYAKHLLSSREFGTGVRARQRVPAGPTLSAESLMSVPGGQHFTRVVTAHGGRS